MLPGDVHEDLARHLNRAGVLLDHLKPELWLDRHRHGLWLGRHVTWTARLKTARADASRPGIAPDYPENG